MKGRELPGTCPPRGHYQIRRLPFGHRRSCPAHRSVWFSADRPRYIPCWRARADRRTGSSRPRRL